MNEAEQQSSSATQLLNWTKVQEAICELVKEATGAPAPLEVPAVTQLQINNDYVWNLAPDGRWRLFSTRGATIPEDYDGPYREANNSEQSILTAAKRQIEEAQQARLLVAARQLLYTLTVAAQEARKAELLDGTSGWAAFVARKLVESGKLTTSTEFTNAQLALLRGLLFKFTEAIPGGPQPMYDAARFTGWMNLLDPVSPHCKRDMHSVFFAITHLVMEITTYTVKKENSCVVA